MLSINCQAKENNYKNMNYQKNIEILNGLEKEVKRIAGEGSVIFEIKGRDGNLTEVSKEDFAR